MTRLPWSASVLQTAGSSMSKNCPSSMPTTSVSTSTSASSSRDDDGVRGGDSHLAVRGDVVVAVAVVDLRLEDLDLLPRDLGAPQPADELFALAAEHAAGNDLDPAAAM